MNIDQAKRVVSRAVQLGLLPAGVRGEEETCVLARKFVRQASYLLNAETEPLHPHIAPGKRRRYQCDVIIPFGNNVRPHWLEESVYSMLHQNFVETIVHVVSDAAGFHLGGELGNHPRVRRYINAKSVGPYISANRASYYYETPYVAVQDADDISLPNRLWLSIERLEQEEADLVGASMEQFIDLESLDNEMMQRRLESTPYHHSGVVWDHINHSRHCVHGTCVYRRSVFEEVNGYANYSSGGDCEFVPRLYAADKHVVIMDTIVALRRLVADSLSHGKKHGAANPEAFQRRKDRFHRDLQIHRSRAPESFGCRDKQANHRDFEKLDDVI